MIFQNRPVIHSKGSKRISTSSFCLLLFLFPSGAEFYCNADADFQCPECGNCPLPYDSGFLSDWEQNFRENIEKEKTMFDESFLRMWELYLSACAATFHNGIIDLHQILMTKGINNDLPMTRWY